MEAYRPRPQRMTMLEDMNRTIVESREAARAREAAQAAHEQASSSSQEREAVS